MSCSNVTRQSVLEQMIGDNLDEIRMADEEGEDCQEDSEEKSQMMKVSQVKRASSTISISVQVERKIRPT